MASFLMQTKAFSAGLCTARSTSTFARRPLLPGNAVSCVRRRSPVSCRALEIDWSDPDTFIGLAGAVLGIGLGVGFPIFYLNRDAKDREKLEYVRQLNRKRFAETGEYMTDEEIAAIRQPRWTDRKEFADDD